MGVEPDLTIQEEHEFAGIKSVGTNSVVFNALLNELLSKKSDLTKDQVLTCIEEKKNRVGGGYLTNQGALFLVASDFGVALKFEDANPKLADVENDMSGISIIVRILAIGPPKKFFRKNKSSEGIVSKIVVYDETSSVSVSLWGSKSMTELLRLGLIPGDAIRLSAAYARAGQSGIPTLNLSEGGTIEKLEDTHPLARMIPPLKEQIKRPFEISPNPLTTVAGIVSGPIRKTNFTRKDASPGYLLSFELVRSQLNPEKVRVVIWENLNPIFGNLQENEYVTLLGVRAKENEFQGNRSLEFHGDDSTIILERWQDTSRWINQAAQSLRESVEGNKPTIETNQRINEIKILPFVARILSIGTYRDEEKNSSHLLICDSLKRKISVTAINAAAEEMALLQRDDVVICKPDSLDLVGMKAICSKEGSLSKVKSERKDIPTSSTIFVEIEKLVSPSIASLDVMCLSESSSREVQTKEGLIKRAEMALGDPTGEIKIYAWRGLSKALDQITAGTRLKFEAVEIQSYERKKYAVLKNYSHISAVNF
jgi:hypothetical protein